MQGRAKKQTNKRNGSSRAIICRRFKKGIALGKPFIRDKARNGSGERFYKEAQARHSPGESLCLIISWGQMHDPGLLMRLATSFITIFVVSLCCLSKQGCQIPWRERQVKGKFYVLLLSDGSEPRLLSNNLKVPRVQQK